MPSMSISVNSRDELVESGAKIDPRMVFLRSILAPEAPDSLISRKFVEISEF